jgi:hypothetical protein
MRTDIPASFGALEGKGRSVFCFTIQRSYNSTFVGGPSSDTATKEILILCPNREIE